jgi:hypothetical protein
MVEHAMHRSDRGNHHVSSGDHLRRAHWVEEIFALTGEDRPGVLAVGMNVGGDFLARLDIPSDNHGIGGFSDDRSNWLTVINGLKKFGAVEDSGLTHWGCGLGVRRFLCGSIVASIGRSFCPIDYFPVFSDRQPLLAIGF